MYLWAGLFPLFTSMHLILEAVIRPPQHVSAPLLHAGGYARGQDVIPGLLGAQDLVGVGRHGPR